MAGFPEDKELDKEKTSCYPNFVRRSRTPEKDPALDNFASERRSTRADLVHINQQSKEKECKGRHTLYAICAFCISDCCSFLSVFNANLTAILSAS